VSLGALACGIAPQVKPADVASPSAAEALFARLLCTASSHEQLVALRLLLTDTWRDGEELTLPAPAPLPAQELQPQQEHENRINGETLVAQQRGQAQQLAVSSLHACWAALFGAMAERGQGDMLLQAFDGFAAGNCSSSNSSNCRSDRGAGCSNSPQRFPLTERECEALVAAAELALGLPAALALGLLSPYKSQQSVAAARLRCCSLPAGDAFVLHLLCAALFRSRFVGLASSGPRPSSVSLLPESATKQQHLQQLAFSQACGLLLGVLPLWDAQPAAADADAATEPPAASAALPVALAVALSSEGATVLLPHAVCQLVDEGQLGTAAQLAAVRLRFHPMLSSFGGAMVVLERYLGCISHAPASTRAAGGGDADNGLQAANVEAMPLPECYAALQSRLTPAARQSYERLAATTRAGP
jgi:hypothetical protein